MKLTKTTFLVNIERENRIIIKIISIGREEVHMYNLLSFLNYHFNLCCTYFVFKNRYFDFKILLTC